jgi:putative ABC transport system ATP-binding protein
MTPAPHETAGTIDLLAARKSYVLRGGASFEALRGITIRIGAGEHVAVLGKSGSGKSTLLNLIAGLDQATEGRVVVGGTDLAHLSEGGLARWRGRNLGIVFQFFQLLPTLTVEENLLLAMDFVGAIAPAARRARARQLLELVGLADQAPKLPATLSGGQQQRAAIARALANDPPFVLADEPTGNLDTETAAAIEALFHGLIREGKTLVMVTHDPALARSARRVIHLQDGRVISDERRAA